MKTVIGILVAAAVLGLAEVLRELYCFGTTYYDVGSEKLQNARQESKIVFLSDLHNRAYGEKNALLLQAIRKEEPQLILIGGDMLIGKLGKVWSEETAEFVKELPSICPVFYANGNHEQRMKRSPDRYQGAYEKYKDKMEKAGVRFLENASEKLSLSVGSITITGLEIPMDCYSRSVRKDLEMNDIKERIGNCGKDGYQILLAHNPLFMRKYWKWGADLVLCGHLHGGLARIPGIGGVIAPNFQLFPRYSGGIYREGRRTAVVSRGLGTHTFHIRLFNPAEMVVLRLRGE